MSDIPDDVMKAAGGVVAEIVADTRLLTMGDVDAAAEPIARAIMAERERCAKVAEGRILRVKIDGALQWQQRSLDAASDRAAVIASAIRSTT